MSGKSHTLFPNWISGAFVSDSSPNDWHCCKAFVGTRLSRRDQDQVNKWGARRRASVEWPSDGKYQSALEELSDDTSAREARLRWWREAGTRYRQKKRNAK